MIGGRPNHALFYLGYTGNDLICLDPHETQAAASVGSKSSPDEEEADLSYHTDQFYRWHMDQLDPSIALVSSGNYGQSSKVLYLVFQKERKLLPIEEKVMISK